MRKPLSLHVAIDVAADADVLPHQHCLRGVAGAQPRLPKPLNRTKGRQRMEMMRTRRSMKRTRWNNHHRSTNRRRRRHRHHHCLTS